MKLLVAVLGLLPLIPSGASLASVSRGSDFETGVRLDAMQLLTQGWRISVDPNDFPLSNESKSRRLLAGFKDPRTDARIFILYTLPTSPLPLGAIDSEPPDALLAHLGAKRAGAKGRIEEDFLGAGFDAIHWTIRSLGDGVTFLPGESSPLVETFGLRTILSFGVIGPGYKVRRVVLSAFLRCESADAEGLTTVFFDLLRTLRSANPSARIVPEAEIPELGSGSVLVDLFTRMGQLVERRREAIAGGSAVTFSREDKETTEAVLEIDPEDYLANHFFSQSRPALDLDTLEGDAREAYLAYLEIAIRSAEALPEPERILAFYEKRVESVQLEQPARPPEVCTEGERWVGPASDRHYSCSRLAFSGPVETILLWLPDDPRQQEVVTAGEQSFRWYSGFESWLPEGAEMGTVLDVETEGVEPVSFAFLQAPKDGVGRWALLKLVAGKELLEAVRGSSQPSLCREGLHSLGMADFDPENLGIALFADGLTRRGIDAVVFEGNAGPTLVRMGDPVEHVLLGTRGAVRRWRRARLSVLCFNAAPM